MSDNMRCLGGFSSRNLLLLLFYFFFQVSKCICGGNLSCKPPCECFPHPNAADKHDSRDQSSSIPIKNVTCASAPEWKYVPNFLDPRIRHLNITHTGITELGWNLNNYRSLQTLCLSHNRISSVGVDNFLHLEQLTVLDLSHNELDLIAPNVFANNNHLLSLNLSYNHIAHIKPGSLLSLPFLEQLDLANNHLVDIDFMHENAHWDAPLSPPTNLSLLNLAGNLLRENSSGWITAAKNGTLPTLIWSSITVLNLSRNLLNMNVSTVLSTFPAVQKLLLSACEITQLNVSVFEAHPNLNFVDLSFNKIRQIESESEESLMKVFQRSQGFSLDLAGNPVMCDCFLIKLENKMTPQRFRQVLRGVGCMNKPSRKLEELRTQCLPVDRSHLFPILVAMLTVCLLIFLTAILFVAHKRYRKRLRDIPASKTLTINEKAWSSSALQALAGQDDGRPMYKQLEALPENSLLDDSLSVSQSLNVDGTVDSGSDTDLEENVYATIEDLYVNSVHMQDERAFSVMTMNRTGKEPITEL